MLYKLLHFGVKGGVAYVTWPTFEFWFPLCIYGIAEDTNFKFGA